MHTDNKRDATANAHPASRLLVPVLTAMAMAVLGAYVMVLHDAVERGQAVRAAFAAGQFVAEDPIEPGSEPLIASAGGTR